MIVAGAGRSRTLMNKFKPGDKVVRELGGGVGEVLGKSPISGSDEQEWAVLFSNGIISCRESKIHLLGAENCLGDNGTAGSDCDCAVCTAERSLASNRVCNCEICRFRREVAAAIDAAWKQNTRGIPEREMIETHEPYWENWRN